MTDITYTERRGQIETYFDRTAVQAWARLDAPTGVLSLASGLTAEVEIVAGESRGVLLAPVQALRELGCKFALDDFGAGMTSLRLLQDLGFEIAKIDGSLVKNVDRLPQGQTACRAAGRVRRRS